MSEIVQVNKQNKTIPTVSDTSAWGEFTTDFFRAVADNTEVDYTQAVYVQQNGSTAFTGFAPSKSKDTLSDGIAVANALLPTAVNRIAIVILDAGVYTWNGLTMPQYVDIIAPSATIDVTSGSIQSTDSKINIKTLTSSAGSIVMYESVGGDNTLIVGEVATSGASSEAILISGGVLQARFEGVDAAGAGSDAIEQSGGTGYINITGLLSADTNVVDQAAGTLYISMGDISGAVVTAGTYQDVIVSQGGTTVGGADTQVQYNDGGSFGANSVFTFNKVLLTPLLTVGGTAATTSSSIINNYNDEQILTILANSSGNHLTAASSGLPFFISESVDAGVNIEDSVFKAGATLNYPTADGSGGDFLQTDGAGNLTFVSPDTVAGPDTAIQYNDSGVHGGLGTFIFNKLGTTAQVTLSGTVSSTLAMSDAGETLTIAVASSASTLSGSSAGVQIENALFNSGTTLNYPTADGGANEFMQTDGGGNLTFASAITAPAGATTEVQFNLAGVLSADSNFTWDNTSKFLRLGGGSNTKRLNVTAFANVSEQIARFSRLDGTTAIDLEIDSGGDARIELRDSANAIQAAIRANGDSYLIGGQFGVGTSSPHSDIQSAGSFATNVTDTAILLTLDETHATVRCDASGGAFDITLPAASTCTGRIYNVKRTNSGANAVTVDANAAETIDGNLTVVLSAQYNNLTIQSNGTGWDIL